MTIGMYGGKFLPFHNGHAYMIDICSRKVDKLYVIVSSSEKRDRNICQNDGIKYMPGDVRASWIGRWIKQYDNIEVLNIVDDWDDYDWKKGSEMIIEAIPENITHVFSSEPDYDEFFKNFYKAEHIIIDSDRATIPISATDIRKDVDSHLHELPRHVSAFFTKKVAIVGTESVGKTTLTTELAQYYNTTFVPEIGRYYCEKYSNKLTVDMFDDIAMDHNRLIREKTEQADRYLFVDSEAVITQYYLNMYFYRQSTFIDEIIKKQDFDLILYLEPNVPWIDDGIRFSGEDKIRNKNNQFLKNMFEKYDIQYKIINKESWQDRFDQAVNYINEL